MENDNPETLAAPPEQSTEQPANPVGHWRRLKNWYADRKKWTIPLTVLIPLIILAGVPWTRFKIAGLFLKKDFTIQITDATAHTPVSGATVSFGPIHALTNGSGQATLPGLKVGGRSFNVTKKYYQADTAYEVVPILKQKADPVVFLVATGRQAKIHITNVITGKALSDVDIQIAGASAKTDSSGNALVVVPAGDKSEKAALSLNGYNDASDTVQISDSLVKENDFSLTPAGKIYYLSDQKGTLDLMKANLDGSGAGIAVAGTGNEQISDSAMLQSPDGKYVALIARRDASDSLPQLYVLAASDDKLLQTDSGDAVFQLYSWSGDTLVYTDQRQDLPGWQQGAAKLKAYNAATGNTTVLDQNAGSDATANANEAYVGVVVTPSDVIYGKIWTGTGDFSAKQNSLQVIGVDGQNHQVLATYNTANNLYFNQHSPDTVYVWQHATDTGTDSYAQYTAGGTLKSVSLTNQQFYQGQNILGQNAYYFSPSGQQAFWSESLDGKNALLVGNPSGNNPTILTSLSGYDAYGWYTDQYLLLSKGNKELYVVGLKGSTPLKITDYQITSTGP